MKINPKFWFIILTFIFVSCEKNNTVPINDPPSQISSITIPHFFIVTENNTSITSKDDYLKATLTIEGNKEYENYTGTTQIKGRGNSTWLLPKKPYRLKLDNSASLLGLAEEKDWVLLANYLDGTLMLNAVAMKIGQLLKMPYTNTIIPVDLSVNTKYMGSYMLTEQVAVGKNRVNIEDGGVLLELDIFFDEPWEFKSSTYDLPVMVKYPKLKTGLELETIKNDFETLEKAVASPTFPNNNYQDYIDVDALVNYLIVYNLTDNEEINHPKSTFMYKPKGGKYMMGPIWDFDWAYGYEDNNVHFASSNTPLFWTTNPPGTEFFTRFLMDPKIKTLYKLKWNTFKETNLPLLLTYIDEYSSLIETSQKNDYKLWLFRGENFRTDVKNLRAWIQNRAKYIDSYTSKF